MRKKSITLLDWFIDYIWLGLFQFLDISFELLFLHSITKTFGFCLKTTN